MRLRSKKINKFVHLAEVEERRSGEMTGQSRARLQSQLDKLGELNAYRHSYTNKSTSGSNLHAVHWKDYQNFLHRLDTARRSQQEIVKDCEHSVDVHRRRWMANRQRLESLGRVMERFQKEEYLHAARLEQRVLDDLHVQPERYGDNKR